MKQIAILSCGAFIIALMFEFPARSNAASATTAASTPQCASETGWNLLVDHGFETYQPDPHNVDATCSYSSLYVLGDPNAAVPGTLPGERSNFTMSFTDDGLQLQYDVAQQAKPRAVVWFSGASSNRDDQVILYIARGDESGAFFEAFVNPLGKCSTLVNDPALQARHDQCSASGFKPKVIPSSPNCEKLYCWSGKLQVSYDTLQKDGLFGPIRLAAGRTAWSPEGFAIRLVSVRNFARAAEWLHVALKSLDAVADERYLIVAPTAGFSAKPHRAADALAYPFAPHTFSGFTFADSSGPVLTIRDDNLSKVLPTDQADNFKCATCASYQTDRWTPHWNQPLTSTAVLGANFKKLGVDNVPFTFDAVGYPVDAGAKLIGGSDAMTVALAAMRGTTSDGPLAEDTAFTAFAPLAQSGRQSVTASLFHVIANRSAANGSEGTRTTNTETSLAYNSSSEESTLGVSGFGRKIVRSFGALARYGTQYGPDAQRFDLAASGMFHPGFASEDENNWQFNAAVGYRLVGAGYNPTDGDFEKYAGLHGYYGALKYAFPEGAPRPLTLALAVQRFSDSVEPRDTSIGLSASRRFSRSSPFLLNGTFTTGHLAVSQVARTVGFTGPIAPQIAAGYLPNSSYSLSVLYKANNNEEASIGYSGGFAQNCNAQSVPSPCYAYRQPSITGSAYYMSQFGAFVTGSIQNQNYIVAAEPWTAAANTFLSQQSVATHVVRNAAIGAVLPGLDCSTVAFTTINQGGTTDAFAKSPPKPGYTYVYSLDFAPAHSYPGVLVAYSRSANIGTNPQDTTSTSQFFVRFLFGLPGNAFVDQMKNACQP